MNDEDNYMGLIQAVILLAVDDYRLTLSSLQLNPMCGSLSKEKERIEDFFRSEWFELLTGVDGESLIIALNVEVKA